MSSNVWPDYDPDTDSYHASVGPDTLVSLSEAVIYLVSEAVEKEPEQIDPLYDVIDPDALDSLFRSTEARTVRVEFRYCGYEVAATSDGEVQVTEAPVDE